MNFNNENIHKSLLKIISKADDYKELLMYFCGSCNIFQIRYQNN